MARDQLLPVIVGVGECVDRPADLGQAADPAALMETALRAAARDAGADLIPRLDRLDIINEVSWPYPDPCAVLASRLGRPGLDARYHPIGGQTPTLCLHEAALAIQGGACEVVAICGGEAEDSVRRARRDGATLPWPSAATDISPLRGGDFQDRLACALGLDSPVHVYPLYENATRAAWGQTLAEGQSESATIWANNAAVAHTREAAWIRRAVDAGAILSGDGGNRLIAWPYRKLMVANPIVNQGAAVILTSVGHARALGIPEARMVHIHGGAAADEPRDILRRGQYDRSVAMEAVLAEAAALAPQGFDAVELYSCFPCVPKMARRALGLGADAALSVAGGLTFFGAPLNNYMTHAAVALAQRLRAGGGTGLLYGQGEYVTKHHALVLGASPPTRALRHDYRCTVVEAACDAAAPPLQPAYRGEAGIETSTVLFDRDERPRHGIVIGRTPGGARIAARVDAGDAASMATLLGETAVVGTRGRVVDGHGGVPVWTAA
jgi:hypothetical protein